MTDHWLPGFYFQETACWVGFVVATLVAAWSLACARAFELATGAAPANTTAGAGEGVRWYNSPACLNTVFPGLIGVFLVHTLVWAGLTNTAYERMVEVVHGPVVAELTAAAVAAAEGMGAAELAVARARALAVVQNGFDTYASLAWHVKAAFLACAGHDLITWIVSRLLKPPVDPASKALTYSPHGQPRSP